MHRQTLIRPDLDAADLENARIWLIEEMSATLDQALADEEA